MVPEEDEIVLTPNAASNCCAQALEASRQDANARMTTVSFFTFFSVSVSTELDVPQAHWVGFGTLAFCHKNL
jgi:hypothetical protein